MSALRTIEHRPGLVAVSVVDQHLEVTVEDSFPDQELLGELVRADIGVRSFAPITGDLAEAFMRLTEPRVGDVEEDDSADEPETQSGPHPTVPREGGGYPHPPGVGG